jgi:hypothetical protein
MSLPYYRLPLPKYVKQRVHILQRTVKGIFNEDVRLRIRFRIE